MVNFSDIKVGDIVVGKAFAGSTERCRIVHEVHQDRVVCSLDKVRGAGYSVVYTMYPEHITEHYRKVEPPKPVALKPRHVEFLRGIPPEGRWLHDHPMRFFENGATTWLPMARVRELARRYVREINRAEGPKLKLEGDRLSWVTE